MKTMGFSFACPSLARSKDEAFERFIETALKEPSKIHSPFPQLARWRYFHQARTQPLIRTKYLPSIDPFYFGESLEEEITNDHEYYHVLRDYAPAKMFSRLLLSRAFDSLTALLRGLNWDDKIEKKWNELVNINANLTNICNSITLSEELLATAISFEGCERNYGLKTSHRKEEEFIGKCTKLPHFDELYYQTFKKVVRWALDESLLDLLEMYLQGIKGSRSPRAIRFHDNAAGGIIVANSAKRCRVLAETVKSIRNAKELHDWLISTIRKSQEIGWFFAATAMVTDEKDFSEQRYSLWKLMVGDSELEYLEVNDEIITLPSLFPPPDRAETVLYPREFEKGWHITFDFLDETQSEEVLDASVRVLELESLLEQLFSGNGFCCPHYVPLEDCFCNPAWKESLNRIARWAKEGKFDQGKFNRGNWRDLPQECRTSL